MININDKPWCKLKKEDIIKQITDLEDETFFFELKSDDVSNKKLIDEVSAFANTYGGYIFIGIDDDRKIVGCTKWTEQRVHSLMHDCITPTPNFDVKKFTIENAYILVIKIEEGIMPPYITNTGKIYERLGTGSFVIKDSSKLSQIYSKRENQLKYIEEKLIIPKIEPYKISNLYAYLDFGFSTIYSETTSLRKGAKLDQLCEYLDKRNVEHSIVYSGNSYVISYGELKANSNQIISNVSNFIVVMADGSVKGRIVLTSKNNDGRVDIVPLLLVKSVFQDIYKIFFNKNYFKYFISADKYEKLTVINQFIPIFDLPNVKVFENYMESHNNKYGGNIIITDGREPISGFSTIDKRYFSERKIRYSYDNLVEYLFPTAYSVLGYIDPIPKDE